MIKNTLSITKILLIFLLLGISKCYSQQYWSMGQCIEYALENNIQLKQQVLQIQNSEFDLLTDKLSFIPTLNSGATHGYNWGQTVDRYTNSFASSRVRSDNYYLFSSITLFNGLNKINKLKQSKIELESQNYNLEKVKNDISLMVASAYLQILFATENLNILKNLNQTTLLQIERMKQLVESGSVTKGELYNIQAQDAQEKSQITDATSSLDIAYLTLMQLLDLPYSKDFEVQIPEVNPKMLEITNFKSPSGIYEQALETRPEIKSAEYKLQSSQLALKQSKGLYYPKLNLEGSIGTGYSGAALQVDGYSTGAETQIGYYYLQNVIQPVYTLQLNPNYKKIPYGDQIKNNINKSISLSLSIPIFNGLNTRINVKKTQINMLNAQYNLETEKLNLQKSIQQAYFDTESAWNKYQASILSEKASNEAFKYTEERYNSKLVNTIDYNLSKNNLVKAQSELIKSKYDYIFKKMILEFYSGNSLKISN